jgi:spermidine/putrescine transport system permease protein
MAQTAAPAPQAPTPTPTPDDRLERRAARARSRTGLWIALPPAVYLIVLFAVPLLIVLVYSFATRSSTGLTILADWNLDSYIRLFNPLVREIAHCRTRSPTTSRPDPRTCATCCSCS